MIYDPLTLAVEGLAQTKKHGRVEEDITEFELEWNLSKRYAALPLYWLSVRVTRVVSVWQSAS